MDLKRLELSGFKSFAKTTVLEFPSRIVAVVGPNGSGKSNIAEAIRWVLGEQSMKMLRGKKGEDLIWNGSPSTGSGHGGMPRMGKASVALVFDNRGGTLPADFEEISLSRKIFRDGTNEYAMNGSPVRLKDVVELGARLGLGESKHNLIGQGEVDRVLLASPRGRREMLEEALGLRLYQLKKNEAERKIDATSVNIQQVEGLVREIAPHLKFLRTQAKRAEARERFVEELRLMQEVYFAREGEAIRREAAAAASRRAPLTAQRDGLSKQIAEIEKEIAVAETHIAEKKSGEGRIEKLAALQDQRRLCERELGRLEGMRDAAREAPPRALTQPITVDVHHISEEIRQFLNEMRSLTEEEADVGMLRSHVLALIEDMERFVETMERGSPAKRQAGEGAGIGQDASGKFEKEIRAMQQNLTAFGEEITRLEEAEQYQRDENRAAYAAIREREAALRAMRDQERGVATALERVQFDEGRMNERKAVFMRERREAGLDAIPRMPAPDPYQDIPQDDLRRKIERMRLKLEEIGGIDDSVKKEYEETEARHIFLEKELADLHAAHAGLKTLIKELDVRVKNDFKEGFAKIKKEFHYYFKVIFGGGSARLQIVKQEVKIQDEMMIEKEGLPSEASAEAEEGIEIEVDLPRKRIKGLAMLSGGERALTAVALLFAIAAVNPPPFLVLDETDAALDEANSRRYATMLRELAKKTQLIVITHNRETMQCAGVLYGVTMGDDGVSRLLSLKLEEADEFTTR